MDKSFFIAALLLVFQQLLRGHVAPDLGGGAKHNFARGNIACHNRSGGNQGILAQGEPRKNSHIGADASSSFHSHAFMKLEALARAPEKIVVGESDFRSDEATITDFRERGYIGFRLQLAPAADADLVFHRDAPPDDREFANLHVLTNRCQVSDHDLASQHAAAIDHRHGPDHAIVANDAGRKLLLAGYRAEGSLHRQLADYAVVINAHIGADDCPGMNHHPASNPAVVTYARIFMDYAVKPQLRTSADLC